MFSGVLNNLTWFLKGKSILREQANLSSYLKESCFGISIGFYIYFSCELLVFVYVHLLIVEYIVAGLPFCKRVITLNCDLNGSTSELLLTVFYF